MDSISGHFVECTNTQQNSVVQCIVISLLGVLNPNKDFVSVCLAIVETAYHVVKMTVVTVSDVTRMPDVMMAYASVSLATKVTVIMSVGYNSMWTHVLKLLVTRLRDVVMVTVNA
ncbi:hypothetical protein X801_10565 [Opisthorchis viverrini]|uniref:Uncharacterized protein n=1 Tax=Opisthorchis viverrini TaxID=6198 RepID=A0A1S8WGT5_OPIVI|nr:hypothetical protein X801_10565 [Opisthorchis viverrini]